MTALLSLATLPAPVLLAFGAVVAGVCFWAAVRLRRGLS